MPIVRELMKPVSILDQDFEQKIESLPHDEARASVMEHALRAQINERIDENPAFYERLSEALERIIRELRERLIDAAEACKRIRRNSAPRSAARKRYRLRTYGLTPVSFAVYGILAGDASNGAGAAGGPTLRCRGNAASYRTGASMSDLRGRCARVIEAANSSGFSSIVDWHENLDVQRELRRDIKRLLRGDRAIQRRRPRRARPPGGRGRAAPASHD